MTCHGDARSTIEHLITKTKRRTDAALSKKGRVVQRKRKKLSAEARQRIDTFNQRHGIDPRPPIVSGRNRFSQKTVTLPKFSWDEA